MMLGLPEKAIPVWMVMGFPRRLDMAVVARLRKVGGGDGIRSECYGRSVLLSVLRMLVLMVQRKLTRK